MILIGDNIIATLKVSTFSLGAVTVRESYTGESPKYPMLVIDETPGNGPADGYADNQPRIVRNIITLESYSQALTVNGKIIPKKKAATQFLIEADKILNDTFGLTMSGQIHEAPYSDPTVFRATANYVVYIDTQTNVLYRRLKRNG